MPDIPDVTIFLEQWYDWYQGYRIIQRSDGTQEQQVLEGERLHDVPPGLLPRTQEELESDEHSGSSSHLRAVESVFNTYLSTPRELETLDLPGENLNTLPNEREDTLDPEDTIFDLTSTPFRRQSSNTLIESFNTFLPEREQPISFIDPEHRTLNLPSTQAHLQEDHSSEPQPEGQIFHPSTGTSTRRIESLRSELQHLRTAIERIMSGLQELGGQIPDSQNAENAERNLDDIHYRLQDFEIPLRLTAAYRSEMVRFNGNNGHRPSMMAGDVLERPRRVRTGTTINNGAVRHHSPDAAMFDTTRRTDAGNRTDVRAQMANARRYLENERRLLDQSAVGRREHMGELMRAINGPSYADEWHHDTGVPPFSAGLPNSPWLGTMPIPVEAEAAGQRGLDRDDGRPAPKEAAEMMCNMECKICFTQVASIALLPCGELWDLRPCFCLYVADRVTDDFLFRTPRYVRMVRGNECAQPSG